MLLPRFEDSADYATLHAGAHRRAAAHLAPPGLTWHLAFRAPYQERARPPARTAAEARRAAAEDTADRRD
ncbi:hypothetical protein, partial [Falsiroseomonas oryzae]|uniref:hypothetical protein n=1 Tax=Falsiroseomonas oryzae TaxID=2766473 RepID=UPI0022EB9EED